MNGLELGKLAELSLAIAYLLCKGHMLRKLCNIYVTVKLKIYIEKHKYSK